MAIDYGGMSALTEIFKGSSAARKNRRAETAAIET